MKCTCFSSRVWASFQALGRYCFLAGPRRLKCQWAKRTAAPFRYWYLVFSNRHLNSLGLDVKFSRKYQIILSFANMLFSILSFTFVATYYRFAIADTLLGDSDNVNLFLELGDDQLPPDDASALLDTGIGIGVDVGAGVGVGVGFDNDIGVGVGEEPYMDYTSWADPDPNSVAPLNDQINSVELAELGDLCEVPSPEEAISPSKARMRMRTRDDNPQNCPASGQQDQSIINQLEFPDLFDLFKPKKKEPTLEPLEVPPPLYYSPPGEDEIECPVDRPVHLCCMRVNTRKYKIDTFPIEYFSVSLCSPGK